MLRICKAITRTSEAMNKNNFRRKDVKDKALYKLWVKYIAVVPMRNTPIIKVYYSYEKKNDPSFGYNKLLTMIQKRLHKIRIAILYNNKTHQEIQRFENEKTNYK